MSSTNQPTGTGPHVHGAGCGHTAVQHKDHVDYLDHGHLHHVHDGHTEEHVVEVSETNPDRCSPEHRARGHESTHQHGPDCGHEAVPHGNHIDYLVDGDHCDDHGPLSVVSH
jgi:hypothetical protein